jgi:diadenosine tetraphosphate (Ap4A) HIT family hydrolase
MNCELCESDGGEVLYRAETWRVVLVDDASYPGFCRVIWNQHIKEMTDLSLSDRAELMGVVLRVEAAMRTAMQPAKINLASLGNVVPHLHWHIIPRFADDAQFPAPIWAEAKRASAPDALDARRARLPQLRAMIIEELGKS